MNTLYFECNMGAAGDMLMAALLELLPDPDNFITELNNVGIPNVNIERQTVIKCAIQGTGINVFVGGVEEGGPLHEHQRGHHHHHTGINEIQTIEAESHAHGRPMEQIHFHEVGTMDAVADITGVCMLIEALAPDKIVTSHIHVGSGQVKCAHGILPVPAPATAYILRGVPTYGGAVNGELCTPTGAALLKHFTDAFVSGNAMRVDKIGCGMGKRSFYAEDGTEILSAVRAMTGRN